MQTCIWYYSYRKSCPLSMFMDGKEQTGVHLYILLQVYYLPSHRIKDLWLPKSIQLLGLGLDEVCFVIRDIHIPDCWKKDILFKGQALPCRLPPATDYKFLVLFFFTLWPMKNPFHYIVPKNIGRFLEKLYT